MNQDIENIIKKNIKHCRYNCYCNVCQLCDEDTHIHCGDCVMDKPQEINTSLIADEVLKVEKEVIKVKIKPIVYGSDNFLENVGYNQAILDILQLLSTLSPNKENENK